MSIILDGTNGITHSAGGDPQTLGATLVGVKNTTSGTVQDFTGIPSGVKRITLVLNGVGTNGSSMKLVQLGTSSGFETTSYTAWSNTLTNVLSRGNSTAGFYIQQGAASEALSGSFTIINISGNTWVTSGALAIDTAGTVVFGGNKTLSGVLDRVRFTTVNGTDTFDAGSINLMYE